MLMLFFVLMIATAVMCPIWHVRWWPLHICAGFRETRYTWPVRFFAGWRGVGIYSEQEHKPFYGKTIIAGWLGHNFRPWKWRFVWDEDLFEV